MQEERLPHRDCIIGILQRPEGIWQATIYCPTPLQPIQDIGVHDGTTREEAIAKAKRFIDEELKGNRTAAGLPE